MSDSGRRMAVISDLDGTLVDTRSANASAYEAAFGAIGVPFDRELYLRSFGLRFDDMARLLAPDATPAVLDEIRVEKASVYRAHIPHMRVNAGLVSVLQVARRSGAAIGLATTARRTNVEAVLDGLELSGLFDAVVCGEDVALGKPAPDAYLVAAVRLEVDPADCVVFEDSRSGIQAAESAGCAVVQVVL